MGIQCVGTQLRPTAVTPRTLASQLKLSVDAKAPEGQVLIEGDPWDRQPAWAADPERERRERWLVEYATSRDPALRSDLLAEYDSFAIALVRELGTRRDAFEDLVQVARIGLLHAIDRFDPTRERPFVAFARVTIIGELKRHLRDRTWRIRPPRSLQENHLTVIRTVDDLTQEFGRSPLIAEISHRTGLSEEEILAAMDAGHTNAVLSLDGLFEDGAGRDPGDESTGFAQVDDALFVARLLAHLPERDRQILTLRFQEGMTQAQIAEILGLSQMSISRTLARVLARLRSTLATVEATTSSGQGRMRM